MFIRQVSSGDAESIFMVFENKEGGVLSHGDVVELDTDNTNGYSIELADAAASIQVVGVVYGPTINDTGDVADGDLAMVVIYGYHPAVLTDGTISAGDGMISASDGTADVGAIGTNDAAFFGTALTTDAGSPTTSDAFIKCM